MYKKREKGGEIKKPDKDFVMPTPVDHVAGDVDEEPETEDVVVTEKDVVVKAGRGRKRRGGSEERHTPPKTAKTTGKDTETDDEKEHERTEEMYRKGIGKK